MIGDLPPEPWLVPLFTSETPVEIVLSIARAFCVNAPEQSFGPEQETLNLNIARMLAVELFRRGADDSEVPWPLRIAAEPHRRSSVTAAHAPARGALSRVG